MIKNAHGPMCGFGPTGLAACITYPACFIAVAATAVAAIAVASGMWHAAGRALMRDRTALITRARLGRVSTN